VAIFRPATRPTELPEKDTARESGTYDFKGSVDPTDARELAKDVAAFANAFGGVVLVGAVEDSATRTLLKYNPMKRPFADKLTIAYEQAVRDRCDPPPIFDAVSIELPPALGTGFVVAVNVRATALGPVGVREDKGESYAFPMRISTHTKNLKPTELAMLMVPEVRRVAIMLEAIPRGERDQVMLLAADKAGEPDCRWVTMVGVDDDFTTLTVKTSKTLTLPLDRVATVWRRDASHWGILIAGRMTIADDGSLVVLPR
jgi:hypothetical protein